MPDEIYDVVGEQGQVIRTATWTECHTKGLLHKSCSALIFKDTSKKEILLQRRSEKMKQEPRKWQHSAGGHTLCGDTPEECIKKELQEELFDNHTLPPFEIKKVTTFRLNDLPNNHELLTLFEVVYPGPFYFGKKEVAEEPRWIKWDDLMQDLQYNPKKYSQAFLDIILVYAKLRTDIKTM